MALGYHIETTFENASPLDWQLAGPDTLFLHMVVDRERFGRNAQITHLHFRVHVEEPHGQTIELRIGHSQNCWNDRLEPAWVHQERIAFRYSLDDGLSWETAEAEILPDDPTTAMILRVPAESHCITVARLVPYTSKDLDALLAELKRNPDVRCEFIGRTVHGRDLEMLTAGNDDAPSSRFLLRARSHPWETGGNWFLEGLLREFCCPQRQALRRRIALCVHPMANKDGVAAGQTRYNAAGYDLSRHWCDAWPADEAIAPENAALQNWLLERQATGQLPDLAICLHNDSVGRLHMGIHPDAAGYARRIRKLDALMRQKTWYTEPLAEPGALGGQGWADGISQKLNVDAVLYEIHAEYAEGLGRIPTHTDWMDLGRCFTDVLAEYDRCLAHFSVDKTAI